MYNENKMKRVRKLLIGVSVVVALIIGFGVGSLGKKEANKEVEKPKMSETKPTTLTEERVKQFLIAYYTKKDLSENRNRYRYHLNRQISDMMKNFPSILEEKLFSAIEKYSKKSARTVLDTAESYIGEDDLDFEEKFKKFKNKLLNNFSYTKLPEQRGIKPGGIGVLESNHTKLCYRMKKQARRWSKEGALTMGKMIIDKAEGKLEELFYGHWREEYEKYRDMNGISAQKFLTKGNPNRGIRQVRQANKLGKRRY